MGISRYWELAVGAWACHVEAVGGWTKITENRTGSAALQVAAVLLICLSMAVTPSASGFPFPWALVLVSGALCFIVAGTRPPNRLHTCFSSCLPVYIGKISYPLYLWHWPVFVFGSALLPSSLCCLWDRLAQVAAALILAMATYPLVEAGFRKWHPTPMWKAILFLLPGIVVAEALLGSLAGPLHSQIFGLEKPVANAWTQFASPITGNTTAASHQEQRAIEPQAQHRAGTPSLVEEKEGAEENHTVKGVVSHPDCRCSIRSQAAQQPPGAQLSKGFHPCTSEGTADIDIDPFPLWKQDKCFIIDIRPILPSELSCLVPHRGSSGRKPAAFLVGDSHARMYVLTLRSALQGFYSVRHLAWVNNECYLPVSAYENGRLNGFGGQIRPAQCHQIAQLASLLRPSDILAVMLATFKFLQRDFSNYTALPQERVRRYVALLKEYRHLSLARNATLLILGDSGYLPVSAKLCMPTPFMPNAPKKCVFDRQEAVGTRSYLRQQLQALAQDPRVLFFDPFPLFCERYTCGALIPGTNTIAYFDENHWNVAGSLYVWPFLCSFLSEKGVFKHNAILHA